MDQITNTSSFTSTSSFTDPLFYLCWRRQSCNTCLKGDVPCSWCAVVSPSLSSSPKLNHLQKTK
ncbi:uncharacterized protein BO87DRAFT_372002 [Aspergillus neoniger CBS 115656]|uniref:Uncharacterized protein n=1 Tax=Aspergillus neoniger (strain CBS 115656) TaxID=1448310 RepID=A0A318ZHZ3_ASPNB|nr:hypothetical protein BO87DRAFT_372002 [Aspergillus neoniger CBS 115656]PYH39858.1 hypothetical protein BO87DRAFT_372002 [Aspergillus neoniger CBS 115656]